VVALTGLMTFYGLERWAKSHTGADDPDTDLPAFAFWLHLGAFALYNSLIGYLCPNGFRTMAQAAWRFTVLR
jgi:hypothetical protein